MSEYVKIAMYINTGFVGGKIIDYYEVNKEEWESFSASQQEVYLDDIALEFLHEVIEFGAYVEEGDE